jgi:hypothetical protein
LFGLDGEDRAKIRDTVVFMMSPGDMRCHVLSLGPSSSLDP